MSYGWIVPVKMMIAAIMSDPTIITAANSSVSFIVRSPESAIYQRIGSWAIGGCYVWG